MGQVGRTRFEVWLERPTGRIAPEKTRVAGTQTPMPAFARVCEVIKQWAASEGAITPGTTVSIKDTNDGGVLFSASYLGYETNLLGKEPIKWPTPEQRTSHPMRKWPR